MSERRISADRLVLELQRARTPGANAQAQVMELAKRVRAEWIEQANKRVLFGKSTYIRAIGEIEQTETGARIVLGIGDTGESAVRMERGWHYPGGIDLRKTLLASPNAKTAKDGHKYMVIPFRHIGPDGEGAGVEKARPLAYAPSLADRVWTRASAYLDAVNHDAPGRGSVPATLGGPILREHHKTGLLTRAIRNEGGGMTTFRTISETVGVGVSWMHPGIKPVSLVPEVAAFARVEWGRMNAGGANDRLR